MPLFRQPKIIVLGASGVRANHTGTTSKTTVASIIVPGGMMGLHGRIRVSALWTNNNSVGSKTVHIDFGGTSWLGSANTTQTTQNQMIVIANRGLANSQVGFGGLSGSFGTSGAAPGTSAIDTTVDQTVTLAVTLASGADNAAIENYLVELIRP